MDRENTDAEQIAKRIKVLNRALEINFKVKAKPLKVSVNQDYYCHRMETKKMNPYFLICISQA